MTEAGGNCCTQPLKNHRRREHEDEMRRLLLKSVDVVVTTVLSEEDCVFALNEGQRTALDAFHGGKYVLALVPTRFSKRGE